MNQSSIADPTFAVKFWVMGCALSSSARYTNHYLLKQGKMVVLGWCALSAGARNIRYNTVSMATDIRHRYRASEDGMKHKQPETVIHQQEHLLGVSLPWGLKLFIHRLASVTKLSSKLHLHQWTGPVFNTL